jgi:cytochrome c oxidase cbb3-type subunit 2
MPRYAFMAAAPIDPADIRQRMRALRLAGVPYTDDQIDHARADLAAQGDVAADTAGLLSRYAKAVPVPGDGRQVTELDALVAYLQMLGTLVNFADTNTERLQQ